MTVIDFFLLLFLLRFGEVYSDCERLPVVDNTSNNATGSGPYMSGTSVKFECNLGYNPTGRSKIYICSGNAWTNGYLVCEEIFCGYVATPENGRVVNSPTNEVGTSINFECNEGYNMVGQSSMLCRTDGKWQPEQPPACEIKMCVDFGLIQYATLFQDTSEVVRNGYGSIVQVTCKSGYVIDGPANVMCQADGTWGARPVCKESTCPPYPGLNSSCILNTHVSTSFLFMACREDVPVTKTGLDYAQCIDGNWEKTEIMACYCNCKVIADLQFVSLHNVNSGFLNHTLTLNWSCKNGSIKTVNRSLICNDGNILKPVCESQVTYVPDTNTDENTVVTVAEMTNKNGITVVPFTDKTGGTAVPVTNKNGSTAAPVTNKNGSRVVPVTYKNGGTVVSVTNKNGSTVVPGADKNGSTLVPVSDKNGSTVYPSPRNADIDSLNVGSYTGVTIWVGSFMVVLAIEI